MANGQSSPIRISYLGGGRRQAAYLKWDNGRFLSVCFRQCGQVLGHLNAGLADKRLERGNARSDDAGSQQTESGP
jgi:hypothetical protein